MNKESLNHVVVFASSYFEYVKLKSFFEKVNASVTPLPLRRSTSASTRRLRRCRGGWRVSTTDSTASCC